MWQTLAQQLCFCSWSTDAIKSLSVAFVFKYHSACLFPPWNLMCAGFLLAAPIKALDIDSHQWMVWQTNMVIGQTIDS
jgi:hypothetical protein